MAVVTRYVNLDSTPGGDGTTSETSGPNRAYASLQEWGNSEETDLVTAQDSHVVRLIGNGIDSTYISLGAAWTTSVEYNITIIVEEGSRHDGRSRDVSGVGYQLKGEGINSSLLGFAGVHVKIYNLDCYCTSTGKKAVRISGGGSVQMYDCIIYSDRTGSGDYAVTSSGGNIEMYNCIVVSTSGARGCDVRNGDSIIYNCIIWVVEDRLVVVADGSVTVINTYAGRPGGTSQCFWTGGDTPDGSNNASSDASSIIDYSDSLTGLAGSSQFVSVTPGEEDFTLLESSALIGEGTPLAEVPADILGNARDASTPDIGAFEYFVANFNTFFSSFVQLSRRVL